MKTLLLCSTNDSGSPFARIWFRVKRDITLTQRKTVHESNFRLLIEKLQFLLLQSKLFYINNNVLMVEEQYI